jgi:Photosynthetic reaction centre cytochrome C subunit
MADQKKFVTSLVLVSIIGLCVAAIKAPEEKKRNLKVLPRNISNEKLDSIMHSYNIALGVKCNFCHVAAKNAIDSLDFASDAEPMKANARKMMRMVIDLNKNYFWFNRNDTAEYLNTVKCKTCHRGAEFPPED